MAKPANDINHLINSATGAAGQKLQYNDTEKFILVCIQMVRVRYQGWDDCDIHIFSHNSDFYELMDIENDNIKVLIIIFLG